MITNFCNPVCSPIVLKLFEIFNYAIIPVGVVIALILGAWLFGFLSYCESFPRE